MTAGAADMGDRLSDGGRGPADGVRMTLDVSRPPSRSPAPSTRFRATASRYKLDPSRLPFWAGPTPAPRHQLEPSIRCSPDNRRSVADPDVVPGLKVREAGRENQRDFEFGERLLDSARRNVIADIVAHRVMAFRGRQSSTLHRLARERKAAHHAIPRRRRLQALR